MLGLCGGDPWAAELVGVVRQVAVHHGAVHGEIGCVDLENKPGPVDGLIFLFHLARDGG